MPYSIGQSSSCPAHKPHAVVGPDGKVAPGGCHPSRERALAHQHALTMNVKDNRAMSEAELAEIGAAAVAEHSRKVQRQSARHTRARRMSTVREPKTEYRNVTEGNIGAVKIDRQGENKGVPVRPGETIWLTEEERRETARAPREAADNPFANGSFAKVSDERQTDTDDRPFDVGHQSPPPEAPAPQEAPQAPEPPAPAQSAPVPVQEAPKPAPAAQTQGGDLRKPVAEETAARHEHEETGVAQPPEGEQIEGEFAATEEVGTPRAPKNATEKPAPKRAAPKPATAAKG